MGRQRVPVQLNQFIGGLNTEASPLGYPINATLDEQNASLLKDGSRRRRKGFDVEANYLAVNTGTGYDDSRPTARNQFRWDNAGGNPEIELMVVQVGNYIGVHDMNEDVLSTSPIYSFTFNTSTYSTNYSFAVIDGTLAIATGLPEITVLTYDDGVVTKEDLRILTRDFFGVEAVVDGVTLTSAQNESIRPSSINDAHAYNLRNQTFALPRVTGNTDATTIIDQIQLFYDSKSGSDRRYPSNADNATAFLNANTNFSSNRTVERFRARDMFNTPLGSGTAPRGFFIIDALERGTSRLAQEAALRAEHSVLGFPVVSLPEDRTPRGATVVAQYSGRVWFTGFSGQVVDGDNLSPKLSSYVFFSQIVQDPTNINRCYQEGDPTSNYDPDVVATDGGFIRLDGAYNIQAMVELQNSLFVFAENGVWQISGGDNTTFNATSYEVARLGSEGCVANKSIVAFEQVIMFWGDKAIYAIAQNEVGGWSMQNVTRDSIQTFYDEIPTSDKAFCTGYYDLESDSFRWLYGNTLTTNSQTNELVFNTRFKSFTKNLITSGASSFGVLTVAGGERFSASTPVDVTVAGEDVTVGGEVVTVSPTSIVRDARSSFYTILLSLSPTMTYTFGGFTSEDPTDWLRLGDDIDTPAYILTGFITGGDARLDKEVPYLTTYFRRTEDEDFGGVESSCLASARWGWTSSVNTGRWSTPREMYRPTRATDGHDLVKTRNKIRGRGPSVAFYFESSPNKTFRLFGWEHNLDTGTEE